MPASTSYERYQELQRFAGWDERRDAERIRRIGLILRPDFTSFIDAFYKNLLGHPATARFLDSPDRVTRLRRLLHDWLEQLFGGGYGEDYVRARWQAGRRHAMVGLPQAFVTLAVGHLRRMMTRRLIELAAAADESFPVAEYLDSLHRLLDLDQAIIEHAYEEAFVEEEKGAERLRLEAVLHQERELSQGLLEHARVIILVLDRDGCIVRFNRFTTELTGHRLDAMRGRCWFECFLPPEEHHTAREQLERMFRYEETSEGIQAILTADGSRRQISWANKVLRDRDGGPIGLLAIGQDITELQQSQERALQAERLAAIGRTSAGLAHESRNALQRIQASSEVLELEVEQNARALEYVRRIQKAGGHLSRLLEELRGYAAEIKLDLAESSLASAWREAWRLLEPQWTGRDVRLIESGPEIDLRLPIDHFRIVQVFRNIMENSLAACGEEVRITVAWDEIEQDGARCVEVRIGDNGPGMDGEQAARIFEPFFTTKSKGTGLGMALAQRFVEAHGGTIAVGRSSSGGAELVISLPRRVPANHLAETS